MSNVEKIGQGVAGLATAGAAGGIGLEIAGMTTLAFGAPAIAVGVGAGIGIVLIAGSIGYSIYGAKKLCDYGTKKLHETKE